MNKQDTIILTLPTSTRNKYWDDAIANYNGLYWVIFIN